MKMVMAINVGWSPLLECAILDLEQAASGVPERNLEGVHSDPWNINGKDQALSKSIL